MKITAIILSLLFLLFAGFQYNDPDGWIWMILYGNIAVLCFLAYLGKFYQIWSLISLAIYGIYFLYLTPAIFEFFTNNFQNSLRSGMSFDKEYIEQTREAGGLVICILALTFLHFGSKSAKAA